MHTDQNTTVHDLRQLMRDFVAERHWQKYHNPRNIAASISVEAGELLELFQWADNDAALERLAKDPEYKRAVGEELSDVLLYAMSLANAMDIDLSHVVHAKMVKNRKKYPADQFKGHYERPLDP